ncbi:MAG: Gfo/Idh/MocA family oxidoreductase [Bacteroidota bacterium]|nr:Gfo/Idh/MocA family oxidoreductase [Bacteroidota bacterium]
MPKTRRQFLTESSKIIAASGLAAIAPIVSLATSEITSANDKIVLGLIGGRNQGFSDLRQALRQPGVECAAFCDTDNTILQQRSDDITKLQGKAPVQYKDFRKLLDNKDIDAVIIGTPDHWHCYQLIAALEAGKDVYVEKPLANSIGECDLMVKAVRKSNRIVQVGQQQRSGDHWKTAMDFIKAGKLGPLRKMLIWANFNYGAGQPKVPDEPVPPGVDFDMWLGPAPQRSFNKARFHGSWRMFWDYGGGLMTDWGVHLLDMALWAKEITQPPLAVLSAGGNLAYPDRAHETFDTMSVSYQMPDHVISWEHTAGTQLGPYGRSYGLAFIGNDATLVIDRDSWHLFPEMENGQYRVTALPPQIGHDAHEPHVKNWLECIRSRKEPACAIEKGRLAAVYTHMANISLRTRTRLEWNEAGKNFGNNTAANALLMPAYRKPWVLPKI